MNFDAQLIMVLVRVAEALERIADAEEAGAYDGEPPGDMPASLDD